MYSATESTFENFGTNESTFENFRLSDPSKFKSRGTIESTLLQRVLLRICTSGAL
jgi:hypothetical protein